MKMESVAVTPAQTITSALPAVAVPAVAAAPVVVSPVVVSTVVVSPVAVTPSGQPGPDLRVVEPSNGLRCPRCGSDAVGPHGSFPLKDGTRQPRYSCHACDKTFSRNTGTPLAYLKKRDRWERLADCLVQGLSLRQTAAALQVQVSTAFRWRHRLLSALDRRPQPPLTGKVAATEAFVRYSEKGSWHTDGPGSRGSGKRLPGRRPFRRFIDGRPSRVLLACNEEHQAAVIAGQGRTTPEGLQGCLGPLFKAGTEVCPSILSPADMASYAEACRRLGLTLLEAGGQWAAGTLAHLGRRVDWFRMGLYRWLARFHGVATRYLQNYLAWHLFNQRTSGLRPGTAGRRLLLEGGTVLSP